MLIRTKGEGIPLEHFQDAIERLAILEVWYHAKLWMDAEESLPNYRLSKFQDLMPAWVESEMVADFLVRHIG